MKLTLGVVSGNSARTPLVAMLRSFLLSSPGVTAKALRKPSTGAFLAALGRRWIGGSYARINTSIARREYLFSELSYSF